MMNEKIVSIAQIKEAKKFREAFIETTDGVERVPSLSEFVDIMAESDRNREQELAEHKMQRRTTVRR